MEETNINNDDEDDSFDEEELIFTENILTIYGPIKDIKRFHKKHKKLNKYDRIINKWIFVEDGFGIGSASISFFSMLQIVQIDLKEYSKENPTITFDNIYNIVHSNMVGCDSFKNDEQIDENFYDDEDDDGDEIRQRFDLYPVDEDDSYYHR